jgi:hypothetical protein
MDCTDDALIAELDEGMGSEDCDATQYATPS